MYRMVEFPSEGATLRGRFYYREDAPVPAPLVIMAHGTSATTTMAIDRYAEVLHAAGLCVLLYDHRNLGQSGGEPRQQINPWVQARGYRSAPHVQAPILFMIAPQDEMPGANPAVSRLAYAAAPQSKELFEIVGGHFGLLYVPSELFDLASRLQRDFLLRHL